MKIYRYLVSNSGIHSAIFPREISSVRFWEVLGACTQILFVTEDQKNDDGNIHEKIDVDDLQNIQNYWEIQIYI